MEHTVRFEEITEETVLDAIRLSGTLLEGQERAVASNAVSIAQAHFAKNAWFRAIYAGDDMVGFIMLDFTSDPRMKDFKHASMWRFMIGGKYQKMGYGRDAILLLIEYLKAQGYEKLFTSCVVNEPSPLQFYLKLGFVDTGEWDDDEKILMRDL
ncbi:MAG: GNAT family N-acetyltransferase [Thermotogaceae bacterium]|nr:GNAT family N-acetyltransferase [Thermotogaceae bacterium]